MTMEVDGKEVSMDSASRRWNKAMGYTDKARQGRDGAGGVGLAARDPHTHEGVRVRVPASVPGVLAVGLRAGRPCPGASVPQLSDGAWTGG